METLLLSLMALASLSFALKLTFAHFWQQAVTLLLAFLFVGLAWPWAIEQSRTEIAAWLADEALMRDLSVLLSIDVILLLSHCWLQAAPESSANVWQRRLRIFLSYYPSLLIFPVLFALLVGAIFALPSVDFATIAWGLALGILPVAALLVVGLRSLLPEVELRLELLFMLNVLILLLGIVATIQSAPATTATEQFNLPALLAVLALVLLLALIGFGHWKWRQHRAQSKTS